MMDQKIKNKTKKKFFFVDNDDDQLLFQMKNENFLN